MKQKEEKILGILAIIFGALALLGSWIPIVNILAFFLRYCRYSPRSFWHRP